MLSIFSRCSVERGLSGWLDTAGQRRVNIWCERPVGTTDWNGLKCSASLLDLNYILNSLYCVDFLTDLIWLVFLVLLFSHFTRHCSDCPPLFFFNLLLILNAPAVLVGSVNRGIIMGFQNNRRERRRKLVFLRVTLWHKHACLLWCIFISVHVMIYDCAIPTGNPQHLRVAFPGVVCGLVSH